ncbi:hypothetical protein LJR153_007107 [Paenibacillus sp. LjRoot153]|uniref:hypothetical protein n=1 Tax=Paenibacillus sp. LjRoot153 TaxID=3342270 RepID=UPI003ECF5096
MIIANRRGLQLGLKTAPVVLSVSFMNALFNVELLYTSGKTFYLQTKRLEGEREYLLHHLTQADLQLAIILQKICNTVGHIPDISALANIYDRLTEYFVEPVCPSQFYAAFEKFRILGLITVEQNTAAGLFSVKLQHYVQEGTGRIGYHIKAHPFLFSSSFSSLSLREQKIFLSFYLQQGVKPTAQKISFRVFKPTNSSDIQYQNITRFLHANTTHVRDSIEVLRSKQILGEEACFSKVFYEKSGRTFDKVFILVNPKLYEVEQVSEYHDPIPLKVTYKRKANFVSQVLSEYNIGEVETYKEGSEFIKMVRLLKTSSSGEIRYLLKKLYDKLTMREAYPNHVVPLIQDEIRSRTKVRTMALAYQYGIDRLVTAGCSESEKDTREYDFASSLSVYSQRELKAIFAEASMKLRQQYLVPASKKSLNYRFDSRLDGVTGIIAVRMSAQRQHKEPYFYLELERAAAQAYIGAYTNEYYLDTGSNQVSDRKVVEQLLDGLKKLPEISFVPHIPDGFRLEDEIHTINRQLVG